MKLKLKIEFMLKKISEWYQFWESSSKLLFDQTYITSIQSGSNCHGQNIKKLSQILRNELVIHYLKCQVKID